MSKTQRARVVIKFSELNLAMIEHKTNFNCALVVHMHSSGVHDLALSPALLIHAIWPVVHGQMLL